MTRFDPPEGHLRDALLVHEGAEQWTLKFGLWELQFEPNVLSCIPSLIAFLRNEISISAVNSSVTWVQNLLRFLDNQGCVHRTYPESGSPSIVNQTAFAYFSNGWYGRYYSHGLWSQLKIAEPRRELVANWVTRTYFLSRSAGATAARAAISSARADVKFAFFKSALEEYSHHDLFYKPSQILSRIGFELLDYSSIPSASLAFDDQMSVIAEHDDLAHIFVALFQEKTVLFSTEANKLYDHLENVFDAANAFKGWRKHIEFDDEHGHSDDLEGLLSSKLSANKDEFHRSILAASVTVDFLIESLNEIEKLECINPFPCNRNIQQIDHELRSVGRLCEFDKLNFDHGQTVELVALLPRVLLSALSNSIGAPGLLVVFGRMLDHLYGAGYKSTAWDCSTNVGVNAIANRLERLSNTPRVFIFILVVVLTLMDKQFMSETGLTHLEKFAMEAMSTGNIGNFEFMEIESSILLIRRSVSRWNRCVAWIP
jgi:hypothetical protein